MDKLQGLVYSSGFWGEVVANADFSGSNVKEEIELYCVSFTVVLCCIVLIAVRINGFSFDSIIC